MDQVLCNSERILLHETTRGMYKEHRISHFMETMLVRIWESNRKILYSLKCGR